MEKNPYESPSAKLINGNNPQVADSTPLKVTLVLTGLTLLVGVVMLMIEYVFNLNDIPGAQFISSFIPAYLTGAYFANKSGGYMSRKTRITAMVYVFVLSLLIVFPVLYFLLPEVTSVFKEFQAWIWAVMIFVLLISFVASYAFIYLGEKTVLDANNRKSQR